MALARVHVDRPLTDLVIRYPAQLKGIRERYFPRKGVAHLSDQIRKIDKGNLLRLYELTPVGTDERLPEVNFRLSPEDTYVCKPYGAAAPLDQITVANADPEINYDQEQAVAAKLALDLRLEYAAVNQTLRNGDLVNVITIPSARRFDNYSSSQSQPLIELQTQADVIELSVGGNRPNRLDMTTQVWTAIANHPDTIDRVRFQTGKTGAVLTPEILEDILRLPRGAVNICGATYNAAKQGDTPSYKTFLGSDIVMAYVEPPGLRVYGFGYEFSFNGFSADPLAVIRVLDQVRGLVGTELIKAIALVDFKVMVEEAMVCLAGCVDVNNSQYGGFLD